MFTRPKSAGISRLESLVVVVTGGLLTALLLPGIDSAREAARRNTCTDNLKRIGLGLHNHHDSKRALPLLSTAPTSPEQTPGPFPQMYQTPGSYDSENPQASAGYSWIVRILPYMEVVEKALFQQISRASNKFSTAAFASSLTPGSSYSDDGPAQLSNPSVGNPHFSQIQLATLRCPSYAGRAYSSKVYSTVGTFTGFVDPAGIAIKGAAVGNYAAMTVTHLGCMTLDSKPSELAGVITAEAPNGILIPATIATRIENLGLNFKTITDGLSKTMMVAETREANYSAWYDGTVNWLVAANPGTTAKNPQGDPNSGAIVLRITNPSNTFQNSYWNVGPQSTPIAATPMTGGPSSLNVGASPYSNWAYMDVSTSRLTNGVSGPPRYIDATNPSWTWGPSSSHSGGIVLHLYGDGSVKPIMDDVDSTLYVQLVTRAGNEPVTPFGCDGEK